MYAGVQLCQKPYGSMHKQPQRPSMHFEPVTIVPGVSQSKLDKRNKAASHVSGCTHFFGSTLTSGCMLQHRMGPSLDTQIHKS